MRALLRRRRGLLDGVVFTGGEALRQDALADAAREVVEAGFRVGLHTAGAYPRRLRDLLDSGLISWVGLDVKALPEHYEAVVGRPSGGAKAWESLRVLLEAEVPFEVRTTVVPGDVTADDAVEVARRVHEAGARVYALQQARGRGTTGDFAVTAEGWDAACERMAASIEALGWSGSPTGRREGIRGAASEPARPGGLGVDGVVLAAAGCRVSLEGVQRPTGILVL